MSNKEDTSNGYLPAVKTMLDLFLEEHGLYQSWADHSKLDKDKALKFNRFVYDLHSHLLEYFGYKMRLPSIRINSDYTIDMIYNYPEENKMMIASVKIVEENSKDEKDIIDISAQDEFGGKMQCRMNLDNIKLAPFLFFCA